MKSTALVKRMLYSCSVLCLSWSIRRCDATNLLNHLGWGNRRLYVELLRVMSEKGSCSRLSSTCARLTVAFFHQSEGEKCYLPSSPCYLPQKSVFRSLPYFIPLVGIEGIYFLTVIVANVVGIAVSLFIYCDVRDL